MATLAQQEFTMRGHNLACRPCIFSSTDLQGEGFPQMMSAFPVRRTLSFVALAAAARRRR